jgi:hypothetical protein
MRRWRLPLVGALALSLGLTPIGPVIGPAAAAPPLPPEVAKANPGSDVIQVRDHRHHGHRHHGHRHHRHRGGNLAIGLGLGIVGGLIAAEAYRSGAAGHYEDDYDAPAGDPRELCAQNFRSFEWETGYYTTFSGERKLCPYLR